MSRARRWTPRANTVVRPQSTGRPPAPDNDWRRPGSLDVDCWPTPGAALARRTVAWFPASVPRELAVAREWLARWESQPPQCRNRAYEAMRDYLAGLQAAVEPHGEFAWWDYWCNY